MLNSMTGFGRATVEGEGLLWTVEASSVNSRFLDAQVRLPRALSGAEFALRKRVGRFVKRGKVTINVSWDMLPGEDEAIRLNQSLARSYIKQLRELQKSERLTGDVSIEVVSALPDLFASATDSGDREARERLLVGALDSALEALNRMRETEGAKMAGDVEERIGLIRIELAGIEKEAEVYAKSLAENVQKRVAELFADISIDPQRLAQEAAFLAERADITEERVRLAAHLDEFEATLGRGGEVGRRFNFLLQEMVRETNTIGSKTGELSVIQRVVKVKEELEKVREQVQNLE